MNSSSKLNASNAAPALLGALLMSSTLPAQAEQVAEHSRKESTTLETVQVLGDEEDGFNVALTEDIIDKQQATDTPPDHRQCPDHHDDHSLEISRRSHG